MSYLHKLNKNGVDMIIHVVEENQTLESIAQQYGVSEQRLAYDNQLSFEEPLVTGQALVVLVPDTLHIVESGDSIASIAEQYGISPVTIYRNNPYLLFDPILLVGDPVVIEFEGDKIDSMFVDGYAYPYIADYVLQETLIYLSSLSIFSYGFTTDGQLLPVSDDRLLDESRSVNVKPMLVLTPFGADGTFSNQLVNTLVESLDVQNRLIENLYRVVTEKEYAGVNVDFEYILAEDKDRYVAFIRRLRERLSPDGYVVSVCLAPKTSINQRGLLYEGIDYAALGEAADYVLCMTYEWGYT